MRNHVGFITAVASAVLVLGFGLIGVGVAEAQADQIGKAGLNLWGNIWFVLGFCLIILSAAALVIAIIAYVRGQRQEQKAELRPGHKLSIGQSLHSPNNRFQLKMQEDGNLVAYLAGKGRPIWFTDTGGKGKSNYLTMQKDGNLVLYTSDRAALWATGTEGQGGKRFVMQDDGNLVIYGEGGRVVWASGTTIS